MVLEYDVIRTPGQRKALAITPAWAILIRINAEFNDDTEKTMANFGRTPESCAGVARGGGPPTPGHDADNKSRTSRVAEEQERLIAWAKKNRKLSPSRRLPPFFAEGGEHRVYYRKSSQRYVKATRTDRHRGYGIALGSFVHGATPSEYLDRLALQNRVFNDDIRLEWIVLNANGPIIITSQPAIQGDPPIQSALDELISAWAAKCSLTAHTTTGTRAC